MTTVTSTTATILDHIITNENNHQTPSIVIDYGITGIFLVLAIVYRDAALKGNKPHKISRSYFNFNEKYFIKDLQLS